MTQPKRVPFSHAQVREPSFIDEARVSIDDLELCERDKTIYDMAAAGYQHYQIAAAVCCSTKTVQRTLARIKEMVQP